MNYVGGISPHTDRSKFSICFNEGRMTLLLDWIGLPGPDSKPSSGAATATQCPNKEQARERGQQGRRKQTNRGTVVEHLYC